MRKKLEHRSKRDTWAERLEAAAHEGVSHDVARYERVQRACCSHHRHLSMNKVHHYPNAVHILALALTWVPFLLACLHGAFHPIGGNGYRQWC